MTGFKHAGVYSSFYLWTKVHCSVTHQIDSLEQCPRGKSRVILGVKEVKPFTEKKKKLKTNSRTRKDCDKKMLLNFQNRNLAISRQNGWKIMKLHKNCSQKQVKYFLPKCADDNWHWRPSLKKVWLGCGLQGMEQWKEESQNLNHLPLFML